MDKAYVRTKLAKHIRQINIGEGPVEMLVLEYHEDGSPKQFVPVDTFLLHFGHIPDVATHAKLRTEDKGKGYSGFFDLWKAEGLIT